MAKKIKVPNLYDFGVIGSGCAGLGAAMYAGRLQMSTVVFGDLPGGTITLTDIVENYPGFKRLTGQELADKLRDHALDYKDFVTIKQTKITGLRHAKELGCFELTTSGGEKYHAKTVLIGTGTKHRELKVPGHDELKTKGVQYCALCDGFFYKDKVVAVIGGSDSAGKEALLLTQWAKKVYIIYRGDKIHPEPVNLERIKANKQIEVIPNTNVIEIKGKDRVEGVVLDKPYKGKKDFKLDGLFVAIGLLPQVELAKQLGVKLNKKNEVEINRKSETNVPGVYAAGDVADTFFKQAITGVAEGVAASYAAYQFVNENEFVCVTSDDEVEKQPKKKGKK